MARHTCHSYKAGSLPSLPWGWLKSHEPLWVYWDEAENIDCLECFLRATHEEEEYGFPPDPTLARAYAFSLRRARFEKKQETLDYLLPKKPRHLARLLSSQDAPVSIDEIQELILKHPRAMRQAADLILRALWIYTHRYRRSSHSSFDNLLRWIVTDHITPEPRPKLTVEEILSRIRGDGDKKDEDEDEYGDEYDDDEYGYENDEEEDS